MLDCLRTSASDISPVALISSCVIAITGLAPSVSALAIREPVTITSSTVSSASSSSLKVTVE